MKTRIFSLPLVILAAFLLGNDVFAQNLAHAPLFAYFDQIPASPAFPDNKTLSSTPPAKFEDYEDLNALQARLETIMTVHTSEKTKFSEITEHAQHEAIPTANLGQTAQNKETSDQAKDILGSLKEMQATKIEFVQNFKRLEGIFEEKIEKANEAARKSQQDHPCNGNSGCLHDQNRKLNDAIISATRDKITNEEYLLSVFLDRIKPSFKSIDEMLQSSNYGDGATGVDAKSIFQGAQRDELMMLTEIIDRIKLERIQISNCAKLAQQN